MLRRWLIKKLKGFSTVEEAIDSIEDSRTRNIVLTRAVKKLFNTIDSEDVLKIGTANQWMCEGKILHDDRKKQLIAQAEVFLSSELWNILQLDIKYQANRRMFLLSKKEEDLIAGKLYLFTLDTIKTRLESMQKGSASIKA